jgi:DNA-binding NarL/FixJ family response regulator
MTTQHPKIFLVDDHQTLTDALRTTLSQDFEVSGAYGSGRDMLRAMEANRPDAVVLDISMPDMNGLETARRISDQYPEVRIVFLTMHMERPYVDEALRSGAIAFVAKRDAASQLVSAIHSALAGERYLSPSVAQPSPEIGAGRDRELLTPRQREVLQLIAEGKSAKMIASALAISTKTVEFHKAAIMDRLGVRSTAELTRYAIDHLIAG